MAKKRMSGARERSMHINQIIFALIGVVVILAMVLSLIQ